MKRLALMSGLVLATFLALAGCQAGGAGGPVPGGGTEPDGSPNEGEWEATQSAAEDLAWDKIPMVMVDGKLYYDTGKTSGVEGRCGMMDGEITSSVDSTEIPAEEGQSNFGTGFGYQYGADDTIEILIDEKWIVFEHRAGDGSQVRFGDRWVDRWGLSEETLEWLDWYNGLPGEEQLAVSYVPADLLDASGISATEDAEAETDG